MRCREQGGAGSREQGGAAHLSPSLLTFLSMSSSTKAGEAARMVERATKLVVVVVEAVVVGFQH